MAKRVPASKVSKASKSTVSKSRTTTKKKKVSKSKKPIRSTKSNPKSQRKFGRRKISRNERANEWGFKNEYERRKFVAEHKTAVEKGKQHVKFLDNTTGGYTFNPIRAAEYWEKVGQFTKKKKITGGMRHDAIAYLMDWEDMTFDDAMSMMRDMYGDSGEEQ